MTHTYTFYSHLENFMCEIMTSKRKQIQKENLAELGMTNSSTWEQTVHYEQSEFRNDVTCENDIKSILGNQYKNRLKCCYMLVQYLLWNTPTSHIIERPISTQNESLLWHYGTVSRVSTAIKTLLKLDCLKRTTDKYWKGKYYYGNDGDRLRSHLQNTAYRYIINRKALQVVKDLCKKLFGKCSWNMNITPEDIEDPNGDEITPQEIEKYKPYARLGKCRINVSNFYKANGGKGLKHFYKIMYKCFMETDPTFRHFMSLRGRLNKNLEPLAKGHYDLNFHISKSGTFVTKIGLRDWNCFCGMKCNETKELFKRENGDYYFQYVESNKDFKGKYFYKELEAQYGWHKSQVYEYDVKSSVPRVLWLMKNGTWLPQSTDIYELIHGQKFTSDVARKCAKQFYLQALFTASPEDLVKNVQHYYTAQEWKSVCYYYNLSDTEEFANPIGFCKVIKKRLNALFGDIKGTDVFKTESELYMLVEERLQKLGIKYVKKFDCFYSNDPRIKNLEGIITACAKEYLALRKNTSLVKEPVKNIKGEREEEAVAVEVTTVNVETLNPLVLLGTDISKINVNTMETNFKMNEPKPYYSKRGKLIGPLGELLL